MAMEKKEINHAAEVADQIRWKTVAWYSGVVFILYIGYRMYSLTRLATTMTGLATSRFAILEMIAFFTWIFNGGTAYHSLDYSMGFLPRALTGQILSFFTGEMLTDRAAAVFLLVAYIIAYALFSVIIGILIDKAARAENYLMAMFPFLFILAPLAVWFRSFFFMNYDTFMLLFALLAFIILLWSKNKKLLWLVPVLSCLGIMANYAYALLFFPLIFALQYYTYIKSGLMRLRLVQLIVTTVSSAALTAYMTLAPFYSELLYRLGLYRYNYEEAVAYLGDKLGRELTGHEILYMSYTVFGMGPTPEDTWVPIATGAFSALHPDVGWFHQRFYINATVIIIPMLFFAFRVWWRMAKGETGFINKSPYYLFMLAPFIIYPAFMVFADIDRLVWSALLAQLLLMIYVFIQNGQNKAFEWLKQITKKDKLAILIIILFALAIILPMLRFNDSQWLNPLELDVILEMAERMDITVP